MPQGWQLVYIVVRAAVSRVEFARRPAGELQLGVCRDVVVAPDGVMGLDQDLALRADQQRAVRVITGRDRGGGDADRPAQESEVVSGDHDQVSPWPGHPSNAAGRPGRYWDLAVW